MRELAAAIAATGEDFRDEGARDEGGVIGPRSGRRRVTTRTRTRTGSGAHEA